ncbi:hypothetical protein PEP31012_03672 [Pandoraea eparura]|uniref:Uncharacterized protein n=1 Tax=Pandoraea eparura TaxID=2508291 RepID=A0A5E4X3S1_9BURK|nr:hypothetical protein PEP31012_03672 [Pandoraea eparura]
MMIRCIPIATCEMCPYRKRHYGQYECSMFNYQRLPDQDASNGIAKGVPDWCPLPPHPSFNAASQAAEERKS